MKIECTVKEKEMILEMAISENIEFTIKENPTTITIKQGLLEVRPCTRLDKRKLLFDDIEIIKWSGDRFGSCYTIAKFVKTDGRYEIQSVCGRMFGVDLNDLKEVATRAIDYLNERLYEMEEV